MLCVHGEMTFLTFGPKLRKIPLLNKKTFNRILLLKAPIYDIYFCSKMSDSMHVQCTVESSQI